MSRTFHFNRTHWLPVVLVVMSLILLISPNLFIVVFLFIVALLYTVISEKKGERFRSLGFVRTKNLMRVVLVCALIGTVTEFFFQVTVNPMLERACRHNIDLDNFFFVKNNIAFLVVMVLYGWLQGALIEEILFRGFLLKKLLVISDTFQHLRKNKEVIMVIYSSILFASIHRYQGLSGVISTGMISLIFGYYFIRSNYNLLYPVLIHGFMNTTAFTIIYFNANDALRNLLYK